VLPADVGLSTAAVFAEADRLGLARPAAELEVRRAAVLAWLAAGGAAPADLLVNDLEPAARALCPAIGAALADARAAGVDVALVTGSGPTVVGLCFGAQGPAIAEAAASELRPRHPRASAAVPVAADFALACPLAGVAA